ncbi:MAG TPA: hypothetical protein VIN08_23620 [Ohtaekwangia sp.]|uniref:hypothetical protein n=1 Tax=Ohtaekwangia sp. TaxID=2066019 RepID=UPI002F94FB37
MNNLHQKVRTFFQAYENRFTRALQGDNALEGTVDDIEGTVNAFAEHFIEASPSGVIAGKNDEAFRRMIPRGNEFYRNIGTCEMKIHNLAITELDARHVMATVQWDSRYEKKNGTLITVSFQVIYLLQHRKNELKIFAYITGDEQSVLAEAGLIQEGRSVI